MNHFDRLCMDIRGTLDRQEGTGWWSVYCPVCGEKRTRTGGFLFTEEEIVYNCFRGKCDGSCRFTVGEVVSRKFKHLMSLIGVKIPVELLTTKRKMTLKEMIEDESHLYKPHKYKNIEPPEGCVPYEESKYKSKELLADFYLKRGCDLEDVFIFDDGKYKGLSAFGMYMNNKLVGMNIVTLQGKYISYFGGNDHVLYIPEKRVHEPVVVVEGGIDAKCFPHAVATLSNKITPEQAFFLKGKDVIMLPDRKGGNKYIDLFHQYGWKICIPDWEEKDLNAAVLRYGRLVVAEKIARGATNNLLDAQIRYKMWAID